MSLRFSLIFVQTKDFSFHLYDSVDMGYCVEIRYKKFGTVLPIDKKQAKALIKQFKEETKITERRVIKVGGMKSGFQSETKTI